MSKSVLDTGIHLKTMLPKEDIMEICRLTGELLQCRDLLRELVEKTKPRDFGLTFCACRVCGNRWEIGKSEYHLSLIHI